MTPHNLLNHHHQHLAHPILPVFTSDGKTKPSKKKRTTGSRSFALFAIVFLAYVGYRRVTKATDTLPSLSQHSALSRRDLKEKLEREARLATDHGGGGWRGIAPPPGVTVFPAAAPTARRLLVCTHSRLAWYNYDTEEFQVIHEGQGVYYGGFPGEEVDGQGRPTTLWVVSRPHNWRPTTSKEWLLQVDAETGKEMQRIPLASRFTHDTVRTKDRVYAADTGDGQILELEFPSMQLLRRMELFTLKEHVNTLSPTVNKTMWAMLHNLGNSALAEIDLTTGRERRRLSGVGLKSHGAVQWRGAIIGLDSDHAALMRIEVPSALDDDSNNAGEERSGNSNKTQVLRLWSAPEPNKYLKGLVVVDDIAFFGIAEAQERQARDSADLNCEVAAFDLIESVLLWRRQLPTRGLLNVLATPHLQVESTAHAVWISNPNLSYRSTPDFMAFLAHAKAAAKRKDGMHIGDPFLDDDDDDGGDAGVGSHVKLTLLDLEPLGETDPLHWYPPLIGGRWATGYPRLDNSAKDRAHGLGSGAQLPLFRWDGYKDLKEYLLGMPADDWTDEAARKSNAWLEGRAGNLNQFKPNTSAIHMIFSDQTGARVVEFPWYKQRFARFVDPLLHRLLGADMANIIRLQFAIMPPDTHIKRHVDKGGYSATGHRIHLVVASNPDVSFHVCEKRKCVPIHVEEGLVFELNNRLDHFVDNNGTTPRIHMVLDVVESPRERIPLRVGQTCNYVDGEIKC